jgi:hypothetical protein
MADDIPLAGALLLAEDAPTLPPFLLIASLDDVEIDFITFAGLEVEPNRYEASRVKGFDLKKLPMQQLRTFCTKNGVTVRVGATHASLLEALAAKKLSIGQSPTNHQDTADEASTGSELYHPDTAGEALSPSELSNQEEDVIKDATLQDVVIEAEKDAVGGDVFDENGVKVMIAVTISGHGIKNIKMLHLRKLCTKVGLKGIRSKNKKVLCHMLAYSKQMDIAHSLAGRSGSKKANKKMAMKIRLLNACFSEQYYGDFVNLNQKKSKDELDRGDAGGNKHFYVRVTDLANDCDDNHTVSLFHWPDNEYLTDATARGLDLHSFDPATWPQGKKLLTEVFKEYNVAMQRFTKSGSHENDLFGDGFTKDLPTYYFYKLLKGKPDAHKAVTTLLDGGVFHVAGGTSKNKRPGEALGEKLQKKEARNAELKIEVAKAVMEPMIQTFMSAMASRDNQREDRKERMAQERLRREDRRQLQEMGGKLDGMVVDLNQFPQSEVGNYLFTHLQSRIEETREQMRELTEDMREQMRELKEDRNKTK